MADSKLPRVPTLAQILERLPQIFPEGVPERGYVVREIAAKTIFVMFYTGAVEGSDRWLRPNQVTRMTDQQARQTSVSQRVAWTERSLKPLTDAIPNRWYADNTREPIRDETLKDGLLALGAVAEREGLPITSPAGRYALTPDFATLFLCPDDEFQAAASDWRARHLTPGALARLKLLKQGVTASEGDAIVVRFPNGEQRRLSPGPSSVISKAVIEEFAARFLSDPGVIFLSESRKKVVARDDTLARAIGLEIPPAKLLPDIILVDLGPDTPKLIFVEVVATAGPVSEKRKASLIELLESANYPTESAVFVTAVEDRGTSVFRNVASSVAWDSFVWCRSEPGCIISYQGEEHSCLLSEV